MMIATCRRLIGRTLLAGPFILDGATRILGPKPFRDPMSRLHIPGRLLPG